ncbi:hypothetical protein [Bradyrhizobium sp. sGM-13]|uniref:hypothetical protein n=1 Tax=Bradyrhizobium sp. sGM-13 TaxID=2831781 RepID=UPI001BCBABF7|nr:hypothetical protein [Bradyrhizobium sp. sGM-13]
MVSAYILKVPEERREILLASERTWRGGWDATEPVEWFGYSRQAPLIVLASFQDGFLTHVADGRKGTAAGTGLAQLKMRGLEKLQTPISFAALLRHVPIKVRQHLERVLKSGGLLPPRTMQAVVAVLERMDQTLAKRLARLSEARARRLATLAPEERENLALQKESLTTALEIAGVGSDSVLDWQLGETKPKSFLEGLPGAYAREDTMLHVDFTSLPGFSVLREAPYLYAKTFAADDDPSNSVLVIMANRRALEEQTGADLIYYNEKYKSFVLVQYKAFEKPGEQHEFRWKDGDQFTEELGRMDKMLEELEKADPDNDPDGFRFSHNPFFLKFCPRISFKPDDKGMFPGLYIPHGLWKALAASSRLKGPRGGNVLTYENVGRRVNKEEFITLVRGAWVGTTINQSTALEPVFREVLESERTVVFAVKRNPPPPPVGITVPVENEPLIGEEPQKIAVMG